MVFRYIGIQARIQITEKNQRSASYERTGTSAVNYADFMKLMIHKITDQERRNVRLLTNLKNLQVEMILQLLMLKKDCIPFSMSRCKKICTYVNRSLFYFIVKYSKDKSMLIVLDEVLISLRLGLLEQRSLYAYLQ